MREAGSNTGEPKRWVVVPAAGVGARMGADCPKQYLPLQGKPLIEHTLERLLALPGIERVLVAVSSTDAYWPELDCSRHGAVETVVGGAERSDSVARALEALVGRAQAHDWVLVHDAARPCVTVANISVMFDCLGDHPIGGILGVPVADTLKRVCDDNAIETTVDRHQLWQAQTPQLFRFEKLRQALARAQAAGFRVTDEASALEHAGDQPLMIEGRSDNLKITRPADLALAQWILHQQEQHA